MLRNTLAQMAERRRARRATWGLDIKTPAERARSYGFVRWKDHGIFREVFENFGQVAPDVYRSNHPHHPRFVKYREMGIKAILNLRGTARRAPFLFEEESCAALGLELHSIALQARKPAPKDQLLQLFAIFDVIPRPFLMHCKSGADRAGLASALYVLDQGGSIAEARAQLSLRYLHLRFTKTGVQDHMLDLFEARQAKGAITIRDWITHEYDPAVLGESFSRQRFIPV